MEILDTSNYLQDCKVEQCSNNIRCEQINDDWPMWAKLSNGELLGFDLGIEAIGVVPNSAFWSTQCPSVLIYLYFKSIKKV